MEVDFAIVGGGPAGLGVAMRAAIAGARALVVERGRGPIDKACGEGLLPPALRHLAELGVEIPAAGRHALEGIRFVDGDTVAEATFIEGPGLGVRRTALSEAMLARARALGVEVWLGTEALGWKEQGERVLLSTSRGDVRARWLVGADGLHSRVRRDAQIGVTAGSPRRLGIRRHFRVRPWSTFVEVHWSDGVEAYVTPSGPERVGVAFLWSRGKGDFETFLARFPGLNQRLGQHAEDAVRGAGPFAQRVETQVKGRVLLVGDAAGYLDPLTGEGISLALEQGAQLVACALKGDPAAYRAAWRRVTRRHLMLTRLLLYVAQRPRLRARVIRALARRPSALQAFLALNTGAWNFLRASPRVFGLGVALLRG